MQSSSTHVTVTREERKIPVISPWVKVMAGMAGGATEALALQPLDVTKTRLQLDKTGRYTGMIDCGRKIVAQEGALSLYKGLAPFVTHLTLKYALRFGSFAFFQSSMSNSSNVSTTAAPSRLESLKPFLAGLSAGLVEAVVIVTPFEVVKTRLQQQEGRSNLKYKGAVHCLTTVVKEEGLPALWRGVMPTMMRNGSNSAFNFGTMALLSTHWLRKREGDGQQIPVWKSSVAGLISASIGPMLNCPLDVVKTRLMAQTVLAGALPKYSGMMSTMGIIVKEEGLAALWKGLMPRLARVAPGQAITWTVVSQVTYMFEH